MPKYTNYSVETVQRRIAFSADDQLIDTFDLNLSPGAGHSILAQNIPTSTLQVEARLLPAETVDYLAADDRALAVAQSGEPISVTLVTPGNLFLETSLSLLPNLTVTQVNPEGVNSLSGASLTILDATLPLTASLPAGNGTFNVNDANSISGCWPD